MLYLLLIKSKLFICFAFASYLILDILAQRKIQNSLTFRVVKYMGIFFLLLFPFFETLRGFGELFLLRVPQSYFSYFTNLFIFPFSDADGYLNGAFELNVHKSLSFNALYRPLGNILNAIILNFCSFNLFSFFVVRAILVTIGLSFLNIQIIRYLNLATAFVVTLVLCRYHNLIINTFLSENWGLFFGSLATGFILIALKKHKIKFFLLGLLLFSIGMDIRTGAVAILPLLLIFGVYFYSDYSKFIRLALLTAIMVLGFTIRPITQKLITGNTKVISNAPLQLYELASNGNVWDQILHDYPFVKNLDFESKFQFAQNKAIQAALSNKKTVVKSLVRRYGEAIPTVGFYKFKNVLSHIDLDYLASLFYILSILSGVYLFAIPKNEKGIVIFAVLIIIGNWLSFPILRGIEERLYVVTFPASFLILGFGINKAIQLLSFNNQMELEEQELLNELIPFAKITRFYIYSLNVVGLLFCIYLINVIRYKPDSPSTNVSSINDTIICLNPVTTIELDTLSETRNHPVISGEDYDKNPIRIDIDSWAGKIDKEIGQPQKYIHFAYSISNKKTMYFTSNFNPFLEEKTARSGTVLIKIDSTSRHQLIKKIPDDFINNNTSI